MWTCNSGSIGGSKSTFLGSNLSSESKVNGRGVSADRYPKPGQGLRTEMSWLMSIVLRKQTTKSNDKNYAVAEGGAFTILSNSNVIPPVTKDGLNFSKSITDFG